MNFYFGNNFPEHEEVEIKRILTQEDLESLTKEELVILCGRLINALNESF